MQSSEQKLLQFGWLAPDFDPKMYLARPYQNKGQVSQYRVRRKCCENEVDGGTKEHNGYCRGRYQSVYSGSVFSSCLYGVDARFYPSIPLRVHRIQVLVSVDDE